MYKISSYLAISHNTTGKTFNRIRANSLILLLVIQTKATKVK